MMNWEQIKRVLAYAYMILIILIALALLMLNSPPG
jgi:hypothetical protein